MKLLKRGYKQSQKQFNERIDSRPEKKLILEGKMPSEYILEKDYPIVAGYNYVAEYSNGKFSVVNSWVQGKVGNLIRDLNNSSPISADVINIYNCDMKARGFFD